MAELATLPPLPDQKAKGWEFTDLSDLDLDAYAPSPRRPPRSGRRRGRRCCRWPRRSTRTRRWSPTGWARWRRARTRSSPATRRAWRDGVLVHVPAGVRSPSRSGSSCRSTSDGAAVAWRTLVVLEEGAEAEVWEHWLLGRRRDRRAAELGGRAARRPGGDAALRRHPGHLRAGLDLLQPARRGRARRPARLDRARLRLGPRQGADGDQAGRPRLGGAGDRRLRRRPRPAPRLTTRPRSTRRRTPSPTSPSAACWRPAPRPSGGG